MSAQATPALSADFFARYPHFRATSSTDTRGERLEYRHRLLIEHNRPVLANRRVLDLASHDGRWSLAALEQGAAHVTGVEGRGYLVEHANATMAAAGIAPARHRFLVGDCIAALGELPRGAFDTVLCFGFLYHTLHHWPLLHAITALEPSVLLIDSTFVLDPLAAMVLAWDDPSYEGAALPEGPEGSGARTLVAVPTPRGLKIMLEQFGWQCRFVANLAPTTDAWDGVEDYRAGRRHLVLAWRRGSADPLPEVR